MDPIKGSKGRIPVKCEDCGHRVTWEIPQGMSTVRFLAAIPCEKCRARKLVSEAPEPPPTQPALPGLGR